MEQFCEAAPTRSDLARDGWHAARAHREAVMVAWEAVNILLESARKAEDAAWEALTETWEARDRALCGPAAEAAQRASDEAHDEKRGHAA